MAAAARVRLLPVTRPPPPPPRGRHPFMGLHCPYSSVRRGVQKGGEGVRVLLREKRRTRSDAEFDREGYMRSSLGVRPGEEADCGVHVPVMLGEVLQVFARRRLHSFVDCTLGAAGHSVAIMRAHPEMRLFVGLDVDTVALEKARARINTLLRASSASGEGKGEGEEGHHHHLKTYIHHRNFRYLKSVLSGMDDESLLPADRGGGVDGILMDLGMSSMQVNNPERGFSVMCDGPLDMRMNSQATLRAGDILNSWPEAEVGRILREYGDECNWRLLQRKIANARAVGGLHSTRDLVDLVRSASRTSGGRQGWIKTSTRVFQALRIAVNDELGALEDALYACFDCLSCGGRLAVISFHSLEDRIIKQTFLDIIDREPRGTNVEESRELLNHGYDDDKEIWSKKRISGRNGVILTKRPITPTEEEDKLNHRCRSAKLRVIEKV